MTTLPEKPGQTAQGVTASKSTQFAQWYPQVLTHAEMIDYTDISGCYVLRPWSYAIWEAIQSFVGGELKEWGVKNAYFPLLVSAEKLQREEEHTEGFAAEVAWVTRSGNSDLAQPLALRPTSETIVHPHISRWIRSHRDLPLRLSQWANVVRWEFRHPTPFIRTREFLWQEGHSAFATEAEADTEVRKALELYARVYEDLLAVPVTRGYKTETEKFAGSGYTTTVEAFIPAAGRAVQGATSHQLGQKFARMFDIRFEDQGGERQHVYQTSWGITTRSIGVMVMVHSDDKGLVLPPRVAPTQVIIIPIVPKGFVIGAVGAAHVLARWLREHNIRVEVDDDTHRSPGAKYNAWEVKGVPLRLEIGPRDVEVESVVAVRRDQTKAQAQTLQWHDLPTQVHQLLDVMQTDLLHRARSDAAEHCKHALAWEEVVSALSQKCTVLAPHCKGATCEQEFKARSRDDSRGSAKALCVPFDQPELPVDTTCVQCGQRARNWTLWGRSY